MSEEQKNKVQHKVIICAERKDAEKINSFLDAGWLVKTITKVNFITTEYLLEKVTPNE